MPRIITSAQNPLVKNLLLLQEKPRARSEQGLFIIEGVREIRLAVESGFGLTSLLFTPEYFPEKEIYKLVQPQVPDIIEVPATVFNRMAYRKGSGGVIALAKPVRLTFSDLLLTNHPLILVIESVEKPGNLGALLRTADAANLDAVIICDPQTDIYNPNTIRSSIGCVFTVPIVTATSEETIAFLSSKKIRMFGTALTATRLYHDTDFRTAVAIIMGTEATGLSNTWLKQADDLIKIQMMGKIDSMNVSTSAAIVIFEAVRQRSFSATLK